CRTSSTSSACESAPTTSRCSAMPASLPHRPTAPVVLPSSATLSSYTVRLPLYKGTANGQTVWFVLLDASDLGLAHDLGLNYAPKLANMAIGCPACVQDVTLDSPTPDQNRLGQATVHFQGAPDFRPTAYL